jgi:hypothetical protein
VDSGSDGYLILGNLHRVSENGPEYSGVAGGCGQGPLIAVVLVRPLRKQFFNVEPWDKLLLAWKDMLGVMVSALLSMEEV